MGCFALAASLADTRSHVNCTLLDWTFSTFTTPVEIWSLLTVFCLKAGVVCLPDRAYIAAIIGLRLWCELDFSTLCVMLHGKAS